ncbi:hypothetical protein [Pseudonocardia xishanensis]|uniref:hypothetical protein n=1 Tax=Pseudonocardia xishanensis TaxID=630995 RepID=UPI0031F0B131
MALLVFGVAFVVGNRLVGWATDRFGPVAVQAVGLAGLLAPAAAAVAAVALGAVVLTRRVDRTAVMVGPA